MNDRRVVRWIRKGIDYLAVFAIGLVIGAVCMSNVKDAYEELGGKCFECGRAY